MTASAAAGADHADRVHASHGPRAGVAAPGSGTARTTGSSPPRGRGQIGEDARKGLNTTAGHRRSANRRRSADSTRTKTAAVTAKTIQ